MAEQRITWSLWFVDLIRFLLDRDLRLATVTPVSVFEWIDWQDVRREPRRGGDDKGPRGTAASTINRRVAAVRALFEYLVMTGMRADNPVPSPRRGQGLRPQARGLLGHLGPRRPRAGWCANRGCCPNPSTPTRWSSSWGRWAPIGIGDGVGDAVRGSAQRRGAIPAAGGGGFRSTSGAGARQGRKERVVPVDAVFFTELSAYLRPERPPGRATAECFVVLRGPTHGAPVTEAGLRSLFRRHRDLSGATRVRPHRLHHTYGTELTSAGIDLAVLRELMGHVSLETIAGRVHQSADQLAAEYGAARASLAGARR